MVAGKRLTSKSFLLALAGGTSLPAAGIDLAAAETRGVGLDADLGGDVTDEPELTATTGGKVFDFGEPKRSLILEKRDRLG